MGPVRLRVSEEAALLNVSRWTVYRWIDEGRLEGTKLGKSTLRVFHVSVMALVEENRRGEGGDRMKEAATGVVFEETDRGKPRRAVTVEMSMNTPSTC